MFKKLKKKEDPDLRSIYKKFRNKLKGMISRAEKAYYERKFKENTNNIKKLMAAIETDYQ